MDSRISGPDGSGNIDADGGFSKHFESIVEFMYDPANGAMTELHNNF